MKTVIRYNKESLDSVVSMVQRFNPCFNNAPSSYIKDRVLACLDSIASGDNYTSTMGFLILAVDEYEEDGKNVISVDFFFDSAVYGNVGYDEFVDVEFSDSSEEDEEPVYTLIADEI